MLVAVCTVGVLLAPATALADDAASSEVDYVALATRLVRDGHYDRADRVLGHVDPKQPGVDLADYHTLRGLVALHFGRSKKAVHAFDAAIRNGKTDDVIFVYLAQAYWGLRDWEKVVLMVDDAAEAGAKIPNLQLMKAQALTRLGRKREAYVVLRAAEDRFPGARAAFVRRRLFLLVDLQLYQEATELGEDYLARRDATADDFLAVGQALLVSRQYDRAIYFLELGRLAHPDASDLVAELAHAYAANDMPLAGADLLEQAAELDPRFVIESAELFRRAGAYGRALYMNAQVDDQPRKFRQRVAILLDRQDYEQVAALESRLRRLGLFDDQNILYALAYAHFQVGDYEAAQHLLARIEDPKLLDGVTQIRRLIVYCREHPDHC